MEEFDFAGLALILAGISLGGIGMLMAGVFLFPEWAERAKRQWLPMVITGLVLIGVSGLILGALGGSLTKGGGAG